jgi:isoleucyl-tRNA synthetase
MVRQNSAACREGHRRRQADADGKKAIRFTPEQYEKTYLNWMENIHDWCISRQLWWGHRIPAWHCANLPQDYHGPSCRPAACPHCGSVKITQETDVLDTWFSSGLLPVSVFGWPNFGAKIPGAPGLDSETWEDAEGAPSIPRSSELGEQSGSPTTLSIPPACSSPASTFFSSGSPA